MGRGNVDRERTEQPEDNSHLGRAFKLAQELLSAQDKSAAAKSSAMRAIQNRTVRKASAKLEKLVARDHAITIILAAFMRRDIPDLDAEGEMKRWLGGGGTDLGPYSGLTKWCDDEVNRLHKVKQRHSLTKTEAALFEALNRTYYPKRPKRPKANLVDERTIERHLQKHYGAHGEAGRPKNT